MHFDRAIVRPPSTNFADGLTTVDLGVPSYKEALEQHHNYCEALRLCGLKLTSLQSDSRYPDSTFVEDTAILTERVAIITRPGAESRRNETVEINETLRPLFPDLRYIQAPGTVDGGDVCESGNNFFIGLSERTNESGAQQLATILNQFDYTSSFIDIREIKNILHLKSGLAYLGDNRLVAIRALADHHHFRKYEVVMVNDNEQYAANSLRLNDFVFLPAGYPRLEESLQKLQYFVVTLEMSEFQKMDGGLSCLSLRF
jgi:dimethylargininase